MTFTRRVYAIFTLCLAALMLAGCGTQIGGEGKGSLRIESRQRDQLTIGDKFDAGYFSVDEKNTLTVVLIEGEPDAPSAAMTIRMFWLPQTGSTPIGKTSTNASVHYVVFGTSLSNRDAADNDGDIGVYSGAGFLYVNSKLNTRQLKAGLWEANIQLADRSEDFVDQVGPSLLAGSIRAQRDDDRVSQLIRQLGRQTTARLGYPRMVSAD